MTTHTEKVYNPATKQGKVVRRYRTTFKRKHGRPRNVGRILKIKELEVQ